MVDVVGNMLSRVSVREGIRNVDNLVVIGVEFIGEVDFVVRRVFNEDFEVWNILFNFDEGVGCCMEVLMIDGWVSGGKRKVMEGGMDRYDDC